MAVSMNLLDSFFTILRAGLWEQDAKMTQRAHLDFDALYDLAGEQSVVGLIVAGLERVNGIEYTRPQVMPFLQYIVAQESRNRAMNSFIGDLVLKMRSARIYTILLKGQGVAQCYARPEWRASGDVDFFFNASCYEKAKAFLIPMASSVDPEEKVKKHQAMTIDGWTVELHGLMPTEISERINSGVRRVQEDIFSNGAVRVWNDGGVNVYLPSPDNDVIIIFTHFLQHFFVGGVGLRQICDWCRLLWTYREEIDRGLLERRLREMGIMSEWKAFAYFAVSYLGMPSEAMPFHSSSSCLSRKARRICRLVLHTGNFGHNQDQSYRRKYPKAIEKTITFFRRFGEFARLSWIFPLDGPRFFLTYVTRRTKAAVL